METEAEPNEVKLYFDYKSPYAFLAMQPGLELPDRYAVNVRWIPFLLRIKGKGQRSIYSEMKVRYSYMDARRMANRRGGLMLRGPLKIYDSTPSLIGAIFAMDQGCFREYSQESFSRFFRRELEIDDADAVGDLIGELGASKDEYLAFLEGDGPRRFEAGLEEAHTDGVFGVPIFAYRGELFWGQDRVALLEERLTESGLRR